MAITSAEIHNQSFSIDRKGYDVDEVDVFLEHVADEIDALNNQIASLERQVDGDDRFDGFDTPATPLPEEQATQVIAPAAPAVAPVSDAALAEKDARIAELERQLEAKKADDNAIAQALIIAQRSADEILSNANAQKAAIIKDAEDEANRILNKAENDRQKVIDAIRTLEDDREDAREAYKELLSDFVSDATRKLAEIGEPAPKAFSLSAHARRPVALNSGDSKETTGRVLAAPAVAPAAAPAGAAAELDGSGAYTTPKMPTGAIVMPATPTPTKVEKDLSGFGDAADDFELEDVD